MLPESELPGQIGLCQPVALADTRFMRCLRRKGDSREYSQQKY